jgi:hypothetical protein
MKNNNPDDKKDLDVEAMRDWDNGEDLTGSTPGKSLFGGLLAILGKKRGKGGPDGRGVGGGLGVRGVDRKSLVGGLGGALGIRAGTPGVVDGSRAGSPEDGGGKSRKESLR